MPCYRISGRGRLKSVSAWSCFKNYVYALLSSQKKVEIPQIILAFLGSKYSYGVGGLLGGLALLIEEKKRRGELAMYMLPKGLESAWLTARGKGWVFRTGEFGEMIVSLDRRSPFCANTDRR